MERREALRRLAGGAGVVGAALVVSQPVFADGGSNSARPAIPAPTIIASPGGVASTSVSFTFPASTCPTNVPTTASIEFRQARTGAGSTTGTSISGPPDTSWTPGTISTRTITWAPPPGGPSVQTIRVRTRVRYICRDFSGTSPAWRCGQFFRIFARDGSGNVTVTTSGVDNTTGSNALWCNSPPPV